MPWKLWPAKGQQVFTLDYKSALLLHSRKQFIRAATMSERTPSEKLWFQLLLLRGKSGFPDTFSTFDCNHRSKNYRQCTASRRPFPQSPRTLSTIEGTGACRWIQVQKGWLAVAYSPQLQGASNIGRMCQQLVREGLSWWLNAVIPNLLLQTCRESPPPRALTFVQQDKKVVL